MTRRQQAQPRLKHCFSLTSLWRAALQTWGSLLLAGYCFTAWATPANTPRPNVVSLAPHTTEILYAAGAHEHILAVDNYSDYPEAARSKRKVGNALQINHETLLALRPDIVWAWQPQQLAPDLVAQLNRLGSKVRFISPESLQDIVAAVRLAGEEFHLGAATQAYADTLQSELNALQARYPQQSPVTVFIEAGTEPLYTIGNDLLIRDVMHTCGAHNVYAQHAIAAPMVNLEDVLSKKPELIITAHKDPALIAQRQQFWQSKLNLPSTAVINFNPDELYRPGPRLLKAVDQLCDRLQQYRLNQP